MHFSTTFTPTAALLTPRGRGAVATIRVLGDCRAIDEAERPLFQAASGRPLSEQPVGRVVFGRWGAVAEDVVVCRVGEFETEVHCHGGEAAADRILADLQAAGYETVSWRDAWETTDGPLATECLAALSRATTLRTAQILLDQWAGTLRSALASLAVDDGTPQTQSQARSRIEELLNWADFGRHLSRPWSVVLAGRPNVGKSSLINALVGYARAIVFDQPGTTRDVVTAETAFDGWPIELADTAGIRAAAEDLESAGIALARRRMAAADCRLLLLDVSRPPHEEDRELLRAWPDALLVAHKCDLPDAWGAALPAEALRVSSLTGAGVEELASAVVNRLVPAVPPPGTAVPVTERQIALLQSALAALERNDESAYRDAFQALQR